MSKTAKKATKLIVKKKKWVNIVTPGFLGERAIGETYLGDSDPVEGRTVSMNLMQVTGYIKAQSCSVKFEVYGMKDGKLQTKIIGYEYLPSAVRRLIRRRMTRVDDSIVSTTKDGVKVRIKPMLMTRNKVSRAIEYRLRAMAKTEVIAFVKSANYEEMFSNIIKNKFQSDLRNKLSYIYPLKGVLIRILKFEKNQALKDTEIPVIKVSKKGALDSEEKKEKKKSSEKPKEEILEQDILEEKEEEKAKAKKAKKEQ